ncbi:MAG: hypothetical protein WCA27_25370 [Candidatus Sulfotelmatobacter sp.]
MPTLKSLWFLLVFSLPLFAQEHRLSEHQLGAYRGSEDAVRSVMNYCDAVDDAVQEEQPNIFAELNIDSTTKSESHRWREFASKDEWEADGKPVPLAFVWNRDGAIVRVTVVSRPPRVGSPVVVRQRVDYCYGTDTKLKRIRAVWHAPTECEFLFPCRLISGHEFLLGGQYPAVTDWVFTADGAIQKLRNGKAVDDYFDPSYSLSINDLHLRTSEDLPFSHPTSQSTPK